MTVASLEVQQTVITDLIAELKAKIDTYQGTYALAARVHDSYERALWNYTLATKDGSKGVHNYAYIKKLLEDSIANFDPATP